MLCVGEIQSLLRERGKQRPYLLVLHISSCYHEVNVAKKVVVSHYMMAENRAAEEPPATSYPSPIVSSLTSVAAAESGVHMCCNAKKWALHPFFHASETRLLGASAHICLLCISLGVLLINFRDKISPKVRLVVHKLCRSLCSSAG